VAALALAAPAFAAGQQHATSTQVKPTNEFITAAAQDDMAEMDLGTLAKQKAQSQSVKQLAERLVTDHQNNERQVKQLAQSKNINMPSQVTEKDKALKDHLASLSGQEFDREYVKAMIEGHKEAVADFELAARQHDDSQLQSYAQKTLPILQEHLRMAENAQNSVVGTSGTMSHNNKK
jgi:putative membrane protein